MRLNRLLILIIPLFIFGACQKTEEVAVKSKKVEEFQIRSVDNPSDDELFTFEYSVPKEYTHIQIKERVYLPNEKISEKTLIETDLEKQSGLLLVKETDTQDKQESYELPLNENQSFSVANDYPLDSTWFNILGANTRQSNQPEFNFLVYVAKQSEYENDTIEYNMEMFDENHDFSKDLEASDVIIIWSCEFKKSE